MPIKTRRTGGYDIWTPEKPETPAVLDKGKAKAAPTTTVIVKGLGQFEVSGSCGLKDIIAMIQERVAEVMGPDVGEVVGLVVQGGALTEAGWRDRRAKIVLAIGWAWSE